MIRSSRNVHNVVGAMHNGALRCVAGFAQHQRASYTTKAGDGNNSGSGGGVTTASSAQGLEQPDISVSLARHAASVPSPPTAAFTSSSLPSDATLARGSLGQQNILAAEERARSDGAAAAASLTAGKRPSHSLVGKGDMSIAAPTAEEIYLARTKHYGPVRNLLERFNEARRGEVELDPDNVLSRIPTEHEVQLHNNNLELVRETFYLSVKARTIGNFTVREFLWMLEPHEWAVAVDAVEGAREAGLRIAPDTYDRLVALLLRANQLKLAMELYQQMLRELVCPHTNTFNALMALCIEKHAPGSAQSIFHEMARRGRQPNIESYELLMRSYSLETPPKWEEAIAVFEKMQRDKPKFVTADTYHAIMTVYLNMSPFDWRVVYNAYHEMRHAEPKIQITWETWEILDAAFKKGYAPVWVRASAFADCWAELTVFFTYEFWKGYLYYMIAMCTLGYIGARFVKAAVDANKMVMNSDLYGDPTMIHTGSDRIIGGSF